jgi:hypothetical protein
VAALHPSPDLQDDGIEAGICQGDCDVLTWSPPSDSSPLSDFYQ